MKVGPPQQKKKRRISSKEMFRTIAFEYKQDDRISIDLLSDIVSSLFYPNEVSGEARRRYKALIFNILKEAAHYDKAINELDFCKAMDQIDKLVSQEFVQSFSDKVFSRFSNQEKVIDEAKFKQLARCLKLNPANDKELFLSIATRQNTIESSKFKDFFK